MTIEGLTNGAAYSLAVAALNEEGMSPLSEEVQGTPLADLTPGMPIQFSPLPGDEEGEAKAAWEAPGETGRKDGVEAEITGYKVYYGLISGGTLTKANGNVVEVTDASKRMAVVSGLSNGLEYQFAITALNEVGEGALSAIEKLTLRPERTVSFKTYGTEAGDSEDFMAKVNYGSEVGTPEDPIKRGNIFQGWFDQESGGTLWDFNTPIEMDITLYARWQPQSYSVTFDSLGGSTISSQMVNFGTTVTAPDPPPSREYYNFLGWHTRDGLGDGDWGDQWTFSQDSMGAGDMTLYAKWTPANEVPESPKSVQVTQAGDGKLTITWQEASDTGAYDGQKGVIQSFRVYYSGGPLDQGTATYEETSGSPGDPRTLTIEGLANGVTYNLAVTALNEEGMSPLSEEVQGTPLADLAPGAPRQEFTPTSTTTEGEARVSWQAPDDTGRKDGAAAEITGYRVYYGLMSEGTLTKANGTVVDVTDPFKRTAAVSGLSNGLEYQFAITAVNEVGEGALSAIEKLTLRPERTVSFKTHGSDTADFEETVTYGSIVSAPEAPTKKGNIFQGWFDQESGGTLWDFNTPIEMDITLYARWQPQSYSVTFDSLGGSTISSQMVNFGTTVTAPDPPPSREYYNFLGWHTRDGLGDGDWGDQWTFSQDSMGAGDMTLYAKWTPANEVPESPEICTGCPGGRRKTDDYLGGGF